MSEKDFEILQNKLKVQDAAIKHLIRAIEPKGLEETKHRDFALALILNEIEPNADIDEYFEKQCKERYLKNAELEKQKDKKMGKIECKNEKLHNILKDLREHLGEWTCKSEAEEYTLLMLDICKMLKKELRDSNAMYKNTVIEHLDKTTQSLNGAQDWLRQSKWRE